ncbi:MAG: CHAT domain-containing protein [Rubrivivax sp.]|nr:CHAT domain-containing protein [Rubrivivax sp.]
MAARPKRGAAPLRVAAFGNPDFGGALAALPAAEAEARAVVGIIGAGRALTGRAATRQALMEALPHADVLHLATHGRFDSLQPLDSALVFSDGRGGTADLTAGDLYGMRMAARLVTLSACETGLGEVRSGDEVIDLYRALLFAGAHTGVASRWEVDDESTALLMTRFLRTPALVAGARGVAQGAGRHCRALAPALLLGRLRRHRQGPAVRVAAAVGSPAAFGPPRSQARRGGRAARFTPGPSAASRGACPPTPGPRRRPSRAPCRGC